MRSNLDEGDNLDEIEAMDSSTGEGYAGNGEQANYCGDGKLDLVTEQCDSDNLGYASCESLGQGVGILKCGPGCYFDVTMCAPSTVPVTPTTDGTTPIGTNTGYGANPFTDSPFANLFSRDAGTSDGGNAFRGRNTNTVE